jgi:hypothetical protein
MPSSLTLTDGQGHVRTYPLDESERVLGRDPSCAFYIASEHISWNHAAIHYVDGRHLIVDLGSTNGTTVNGQSASSPILLRPNDQIILADAVQLEFQTDDIERTSAKGLGRIVGILAAIVVIGLAIAAAFWLVPGDEPDPELTRAVELAEQGIDFARDGKQFDARDALREAAGQLYTAGYLDQVPRGDLQREAMRLLQDQVDVSFDLWGFYDNVLRQAPPPRAAAATRGKRCRLDSVPSNLLEPCLLYWIEHVLREIHQDTDSIPPDFHRKVGRRLRIENKFLRNSLVRGEPLVPMLKDELVAAKMPPLLHYVALIESGYKNSATSSTAAAGVWQFMPATGRQYGLRVKGKIDDRRDPEKSTRAAARYLRDLAFEFGGDALLLALAGYNRGENGVRRSLKKLDDPFSDRSYWRLVERDLLPEETQNYVPRFIAAAVAGEGGLPPVQLLREAGY